jgi:hypothetical protein
MAMLLSAELFGEIITNLRSDVTKVSTHEKRRQARVGLRCALEILPSPFIEKKIKPISLLVHDISQNGIGLVSSVKLDENAEFVARFPRDGHPAVPVLYKTRYCRRLSSEQYAVGAIFMRVLPDAWGNVVKLNRRTKAISPTEAQTHATPADSHTAMARPSTETDSQSDLRNLAQNPAALMDS